MPKKLKSGSGHHRLKICGPCNGHLKIAQDRPDVFAVLRSIPSAIEDALDTLYEPNAVFNKFLGSASMTFFYFFPFHASSSSLFFSCSPFFFSSFLSFFVCFWLPFFFFPSFVFSSFLYFVFPIVLRLSCICVVIGTTCNVYVVDFLGGKRYTRFSGGSSETCASVWTWHIVS